MFAQVAWLQRFSVLLGHPTYALVVVLFSMISFAGIGSLLSERIVGPGRLPLLGADVDDRRSAPRHRPDDRRARLRLCRGRGRWPRASRSWWRWWHPCRCCSACAFRTGRDSSNGATPMRCRGCGAPMAARACSVAGVDRGRDRVDDVADRSQPAAGGRALRWVAVAGAWHRGILGYICQCLSTISRAPRANVRYDHAHWISTNRRFLKPLR